MLERLFSIFLRLLGLLGYGVTPDADDEYDGPIADHPEDVEVEEMFEAHSDEDASNPTRAGGMASDEAEHDVIEGGI